MAEEEEEEENITMKNKKNNNNTLIPYSPAHFNPLMAVEVLPKIMNSMVVAMMSETQIASERQSK